MSLANCSPAELAKLSRMEKVALLSRLEGRAATNQTAADLTAYRDEPVRFCREVLGVEPWSMQERILAAIASEARVTVRSGNGSGKTVLAAWTALWFTMTRPGSIVVTTAPTGRQVKDLLWRRIRTAYAASKVPLPGRCQTTMLECGTDWYAIGVATDEETKFQGPHSAAGVMLIGDEASGLAEWLFAAMEGCMTEAHAKMLLIGNPNQAMGTFYESHRTWPASQRFHISAYDTPPEIIRREWIEEKRRDWGEESPLYQVRVLGNFPPQAEGSLIALAWAEAAQQAELALEAEQPLEIGVDMAAGGGDECVLYARRGKKVIAWDYWHNPDTMASAGRIASYARKLGAAVVKVDDIGIGKGTTDFLRTELEHDRILVQGVNVAEAARDGERFYNQRSELFWGLADRFKAGEIDIPAGDDLLMDQLTQLRYRFTPRGQVRLESKEELKKERPATSRWQSPDRADALCLAFAQGGNPWIPVSPEAPCWEPRW